MNRMNELTEIVPSEPDFTIDWNRIENGFMHIYAADMARTQQNPKYHAEGDVWTHTKMVCESLVSYDMYRQLSDRHRQELFIAALLHDVGKISTTRLENGEWTSPNHAIVGANIVRELMWRDYGLCGTKELQNFRETICLLVRYHMTAPYIFESNDPDFRLIKTASNGELALDFTLKLLFILSKADVEGKISENNRKSSETVILDAELAKEAGCYHHPLRFSSSYAEFAYLLGRNVTPDTELYNDTQLEVILLCGLPGTGKDTWINERYADYPVVSLDDIREEYGISPVGDQQEVVRIAKARAKQYLRDKQSFVWNATSITTDIRSQLINLFVRYHAYVKIVFLETEWEENRRRNSERLDKVPESVIERMLKKLILPERFEAHEVEWICV